jgi:hypothetical protein
LVARISGGYRADTGIWSVVLYCSRGISRIQGFEACITVIRVGFIYRVYGGFYFHSDCNYLIINNIKFTDVSKVFLLGANVKYDTDRQVVAKNQIIQMNGYEDDRYVVYDIVSSQWGLSCELINLRTKQFGQCDLIRPLSRKFGIGYYFDDENPQFMDAFEVAVLQSEAEQNRQAEQAAKQQRGEHDERLKTIGRQRLEAIVPEDARAVIVAELHEDESDSMTDYYGYRTKRIVIPGFSTHTKTCFPRCADMQPTLKKRRIWQLKTRNTNTGKSIRWATVTIWVKANITAG